MNLATLQGKCLLMASLVVDVFSLDPKLCQPTHKINKNVLFSVPFDAIHGTHPLSMDPSGELLT